jgi:hypothetical protein
MTLRTLQFDTPDALATFANAAQEVLTAAIVAGGTGYQINDVLNVVGGEGEVIARLEVTAEVGNVITGISVEREGAYTTVPSNPVSVTGGFGNDDATFNLTSGAAVQQADVQSIKEKDNRWYLQYAV